MASEFRSVPLRWTLDVDRQIEAAFAEMIHEPWQGGRPALGPVLPPADVVETSDAYLVAVELPGMSPHDVRVQVTSRELTIHGTRSGMHWSRVGRTVRLERMRGEVHRSMEFERPIDPERVQVQFEHGVLRITLPKQSLMPTPPS